MQVPVIFAMVASLATTALAGYCFRTDSKCNGESFLTMSREECCAHGWDELSRLRPESALHSLVWPTRISLRSIS